VEGCKAQFTKSQLGQVKNCDSVAPLDGSAITVMVWGGIHAVSQLLVAGSRSAVFVCGVQHGFGVTLTLPWKCR
jgi:hypothetical protein